jgi:hypothetical protein
MDKETLSIFLSFALYGVIFLVPLIPSILIYKIFPNTSVTTTGKLSNFKINTSGAFAAYLATVLIGIVALSGTQKQILKMKNPVAPTWTILGNLELIDSDGKKVNNPKMFDQVCVSMKPEIFLSANGDIHFKIPGTLENVLPQRMITIDVTGFGRGKINLTSIDPKKSKNMIIDFKNNTINFIEPIKITAQNNPSAPYKQTEYINPESGVK